MTTILYLAEGNAATSNPLDSPIGPLFPMPYDIVWSLIPFFLILFLFWKFVLPKFKAVLEERENQIEGGIARAEAAQVEAKSALEQYNAQLAEARTEASQIREDARNQGQKIIADMKDQATTESNRIIESGEKQLLAQRDAVVSQLRQEVGLNSINLAERLLGSQLDDSVKASDSIDTFLSELNNIQTAGK